MDLVIILHGSFSSIFVIVSFVIGLRILSKYFKSKNRLLILVGIAWVVLSFPWLPDSISFLMNLISNEQQSLSPELYFIIGNVFVPIALITWIIAYTDMVNKKKQGLAVGLILFFSFIFEVIFFYLFFTNIDLIGVYNPLIPFSADFGIFLITFYLATILILLPTGLHFAQKSIKLENKELRLKGKLLRAAFIIFTIATVLEKPARSIMIGVVFQDPTDPLLLIMLAVVRVLLMVSAFAFYGGFLLPRWMKELLLNE